jgi:hypothetical protein
MDQSYFATNEATWNYLGIDEDPPSGKIQVLTVGGISTIGTRHTDGIIAWAPLIKRDKFKEQIQQEYKDRPHEMRQAWYAFVQQILQTHMKTRYNKDITLPLVKKNLSKEDIAKERARCMRIKDIIELLDNGDE